MAKDEQVKGRLTTIWLPLINLVGLILIAALQISYAAGGQVATVKTDTATTTVTIAELKAKDTERAAENRVLMERLSQVDVKLATIATSLTGIKENFDRHLTVKP